MLRVILAAVVLAPVGALLVNNGVDGEPEVECGPTDITVSVNTLNPFEGHVFVKGRHAEEGCRQSGSGIRAAGIRLPFEQCGVSRVRSLRPRGVFVEVTLIASFHPLFVTKVDRAYRVQCFYMETDKTVEAEHELGISHLPVADVTQGVPMPVCRYEVLEGGPAGEPLLFAEVGQSVYHKWNCDTETIDTFCMVVRDCFVDDKQGDKVELINSQGCAVDRFLLANIEYTSNLAGGVHANVFKYADRPRLAFQCQISIFVKEPHEACPRPYCAQPAGRGAGSENLKEGPPPSAPDHPFPLAAGSPYNAPEDAPARDPIPVPPDANEGYQQESPRAPPPPPPAKPIVAGHLGRRSGYEAERASLRAQIYNQYRSKRAADVIDIGVVDVRAELNALEVEEELSQLPPSAQKRPRVRVSDREVCVSTPTVGVFLGGAALALFAAVGFCALAILKAPSKA